ncbi:uncharacterized protein LOC105421143 isoform X2 [Amborella trichopoda]|uniref:uncharacterized protein LOC105421143 isoform X2 n=1 Tax=Amborella trichopoda TaxID=13333 RepID=UPI0009C0B568|nr:uncharacterized protein LOC105421143 isoform X2 [Amborella trichopoda]|eukprot:XP_020527131.1 uncharacterized protein LOC105421143 isoform X2 [Amborella trichopoda]
MSRRKVPDVARDHGKINPRNGYHVTCNYCGKTVTSLARLKYHLACIPGEVLPCGKVPEDVKTQMTTAVIEMSKASQSASFKKQRVNVGTEVESKMESSSSPLYPLGSNDKWRHACMCIGRFFYESGMELSASESPAFQNMIEAIINCGFGYNSPSVHELRGWILKEEVKEINEHLKEVKCSWGRTGCSILCDDFVDEMGRTFLNFIVDCPQGTIYLKSIDASEFTADLNSLCNSFERIIEEVGIENVVQVITNGVTCDMEDVGQKLMKKHKGFFWSPCTAHCINIMLEEMEKMNDVKVVLDEAKSITRFIYNSAQFLKLMRMHTQGQELVQQAETRIVACFLTLQRIVSEKENLRNMFNSPTWKTSIWASRNEGIELENLIWDLRFWERAEVVVKATIPLIQVLNLLDDKYLMGYIYEAMDQAKEIIKINFGDEGSKYLPFWKLIDDIWNNKLHSPLHAAGYVLNPIYFYSKDFYSDPEVASGLIECIDRMNADLHSQDLVLQELDKYKGAQDGFAKGMTISQQNKCLPADWWSSYGGHCPNLQRVALRILSQSCSTLKCKLDWSLMKQLHTGRRNKIEHERLTDLVSLHYNLQLRNMNSTMNSNKPTKEMVINQMNDWVVGLQEHVFHCETSSWMDLEFEDTDVVDKACSQVPPSFQPKEELD